MKRITLALVAILVVVALWLTLAPPRAWLNLTKRVDVSPQTGAALVARYECRRCHTIGGQGAALAPVLTAKDDQAAARLRQFVISPRGGMPNLHLSDSEIEAIIAYVKTY